MKYGFIKTACATPAVRVADCSYNAQQIVEAVRSASAQGVEVLCLPELCVTGYTCEDLFFQETLLAGALDALREIAGQTAQLPPLFCVGLPLVHGGKLYNCAAVLQKGRVLGIVPKTYIPGYREFYEPRHFTPAPPENGVLCLWGQEVPFGTRLLFCADGDEACKVAVEVCEDLWSPLPPSIGHALAGATIILNLSASDEVAGKADYRRALVTGQSARLLCGYVYADAGEGESTTDLVFAGHNLIAENGTLLAESEPFQGHLTMTELDVQRLAGERRRSTNFGGVKDSRYLHIPFTCGFTCPLTRAIEPAPFVPQDAAKRAKRCGDILEMQAQGLKKRMRHTRCKTVVLGISGGLDSTLALLVVTRAFHLLDKPLTDIVAVTMPCFGTTRRTRSNAERLCGELGVSLRQIDITETVQSNFRDIGQDAATYDVTFENTQARVRTLVLMNLANRLNGLVVGTGDLSELALGWATYNGDHMSMYGVNASVPKTLVRHIVETVALESPAALKDVLLDILDTPVSPELLPAEDGVISQQTEQLVGPYELHDFFLYYALRFGFAPAKIYFLARQAFAGRYDNDTLLQWLRNFYKRFFAQQFKRSCLPDGPKVGTVTLSPRGDWRMPSDACAALWLQEIENLS